jgi:proteasome beta subunit
MTLVLALRCRDGVVLAADSQRTEGSLRETFPKLFVSPSGIAWGGAGNIAIQQEVYAGLRDLARPAHPSRDAGREAIVHALVAARERATASLENPTPASSDFQGLFAWYSEREGRTFLLRALSTGYAEFARRYAAVGGPSGFARFALSTSEYLEFETLSLEAAKMVAFNVADDVIRASASGVSPPVQLAVVHAGGEAVVAELERRGLEDTVAAFREHQRDFLVRGEEALAERDTGLRP